MSKRNHGTDQFVQEVLDKLYALDRRGDVDPEVRQALWLIAEVLKRQDAKIRAVLSRLDRMPR